MTLDNFPRGGKKPLTKSSTNYLFDKKQKQKKPTVKKDKNEFSKPNFEETIIASTAECLTHTSLTEGMILLGRVHKSTEYDVSISLPGRLSGSLNVGDVSKDYTKLLKDLVSSGTEPDDLKPLSELFQPKNYITCYVKKIENDGKLSTILSVDPELINQNLDPGKLKKGSKIICSIASAEDHGYVVNTGLINFRGFIENKDVPKETKYYPGQQLFCAVKSLTTTDNVTTARLSTKTKNTNSSVISEGQALDALAPGIKFSLTVKKILVNGLQVIFNEKNIGYIHQLYLQRSLTDYVENSEIDGTLMYILPTVKFSYFTEIPLENEEKSLEPGQVMKAKVIHRDAKGFILKLKHNFTGFLPFKRTGISLENISEKFALNSKHQCKILTYDVFDRVYICTADKLDVTVYKTPEEVKPGDILDVKINNKHKKNGKCWWFVQSRGIIGDVFPEHFPDTKDEPEVGSKCLARVLSKVKNGNKFIFTLKKSLIESELPILDDFSKAKIGSSFLGTIISLDGGGILVKFYGDVMGRVHRKKLNTKNGSLKNFKIGQVISVQIIHIHEAEKKLSLDLTEQETKSEKIPLEIGETVTGTIIDSSIDGIYLRIPLGDRKDITAYLPANHLSLCKETGKSLAARAVPGDELSAVVFSTTPELILTKILSSKECFRDFESLNPGDCVPCSITEISKTGIKVLLPIKNLQCFGTIALNRLDNIKLLSIHQLLFGKILRCNKKHQEIHLTAKLADVWSLTNTKDQSKPSEVLAPCVDSLTLYFSKMMELTQQLYYKDKPILSIKLGQKIRGTVDKITEHGLILKLENNVVGTVRTAHIAGDPKVGDEVNGAVLWINYLHELVEITLNSPLVNNLKAKKKIPLVASGHLRGEIVLVDPWFILVLVKGEGKRNLVALPAKSHVNDLQPDLSEYVIGRKIKCFVALTDEESVIVPICLPKSTLIVIEKYDIDKNKPREFRKRIIVKKEDIKEEESDENKKEIENPDSSQNEKSEEPIKEGNSKDSIDEVEVLNQIDENPKSSKRKLEESSKTSKKKKKMENSPDEPVHEKYSKRKLVEISENIKKNLKKNNLEEESLKIPECGFFWDTKPDHHLAEPSSSSSDEEDETNEPIKKKKKLNATERRELERQKEREIREKEEALSSNQLPNSVDQFDRLVLASPDSSLIWLQYMAYHLQATEIEKARAIANRALKTINFREEDEKLNVWQGWLNLESRFGSPETLNKVLQDALRANDAMKIHLHMLTVHEDAGRIPEVEKTVQILTKKYKNSLHVWVKCGEALLKLGLKEKSRFIMQRALQSLRDQDHVNLMVQFAQLETKFGDAERAQTLYENILTSYPKRVDVWSIYVDSFVKSGKIEFARNVLERAVSQNLPPQKMKTLFTKFVKFEEQHGNDERVTYARELAVKYVENVKKC